MKTDPSDARPQAYETLLLELRQANADMERGVFRILKQEGGGAEPQDITAEAIRTNKISIVLLEGIIRMQGPPSSS